MGSHSPMLCRRPRRVVYDQQQALKPDEVALAARASKVSAVTEVLRSSCRAREVNSFSGRRAERVDSFPYSSH